MSNRLTLAAVAAIVTLIVLTPIAAGAPEAKQPFSGSRTLTASGAGCWPRSLRHRVVGFQSSITGYARPREGDLAGPHGSGCREVR